MLSSSGLIANIITRILSMYILLSIYNISKFSGWRSHITKHIIILCASRFSGQNLIEKSFCWQIICITWTAKDWKITCYFQVDFYRNKICFLFKLIIIIFEKQLQKVNTFKPSHKRPDTHRTALNDYFIDWVIYKLELGGRGGRAV